MSEQIHIIIAGDEHSPKSFKFSRRGLVITAAVVFFVASALFSMGFYTTGLFAYNTLLVKKIDSSRKEVNETRTANALLEKRLAMILASHEKTLDDLKTENDLAIFRLKLDSNRKIAELEKKNFEQEMTFKEERDLLLSTAVSELNARSEFIENVISDIGITIKPDPKGSQQNSGGPFVAAENGVYDDLIYRTDYYLKTIQTLPLGKPVAGSVSSGFGKRRDPLNNKKAFHEGIDLRGKKGEPVKATADGKVIFAGKNGGYGKCVKIDHGNGYTTNFAHLHKYHVKKGDSVNRGQTIGLVGNSGRSTGSHLHYEIAYKGKPINPGKLMKIADLTYEIQTSLEK